MSRLAYFVRETLISLRRNLLMTLAGIITVAVSLALFGGIRLVQTVVDHGTSKWKDGVELEIFMDLEAGEKQIEEVRRQLEADEDVRRFRFLTKEDAYNEFKRIFRDEPELIESMTPDALPTSFRVAPTEAELTEQVKRRFESVSGVDEVITPQEQIEKILDITRWINYVFTAMAVVLLASSVFLIVNTIRLATFARRREIEVMKLVGASNWFVRIPFMAEGLVQGAIGAGFAFGLIFLLKVVVADFVEGASRLWQGFYVTNADVIGIGLFVLVIGGGVGVLGSIIGLRRFLDA